MGGSVGGVNVFCRRKIRRYKTETDCKPVNVCHVHSMATLQITAQQIVLFQGPGAWAGVSDMIMC